MLAACGSKDDDKTAAPKEDDKATGQEESGEPNAEQVLNLIESAAIPSVDSAIVEDAVGFNVLNNVNEGLYRLNLENVAEPAMAAEESGSE